MTTRDLSAKRNLGLVLAWMLGWQCLMFLDDDIYGFAKQDVDALAAGLSDHSVSTLIPDNSVVCHAQRPGGGVQGKFASAGAMGVRCDRDDLAFFPSIYNGNWLFFSGEAASGKIAEVGWSKQRPCAGPFLRVSRSHSPGAASETMIRTGAGKSALARSPSAPPRSN